ncbi:MAG: D-glycero-alpha-D-manno-heptose-1,7-bisphosphate 7-phosphatase [Patescibacteria group bacterium]|jgi:D-glycero-D-manno-heptose 1,7-bisphosphate phosphatase
MAIVNNRAVFVDKDDTVNFDKPFYNYNPDLIKIIPGASEGLSMLREKGYKVVLVTNQSGVARGYFEEKDLAPLFEKLQYLLNFRFDGIYYCPHYIGGSVNDFAVACECRKPEIGLLLKAAKELSFDLNSSWMVGDRTSDMEAGKRAGCNTVMIDRNCEYTAFPLADYICRNMKEAAEIIVSSLEDNKHEKEAKGNH